MKIKDCSTCACWIGDEICTNPKECLVDNVFTQWRESKDEIIAEQDRLIGELTRKVHYLEDAQMRYQGWKRKAKEEAGYNDKISFNIVWKDTLGKAEKLKCCANCKNKYIENMQVFCNKDYEVVNPDYLCDNWQFDTDFLKRNEL